jgi:hypothetical protein
MGTYTTVGESPLANTEWSALRRRFNLSPGAMFSNGAFFHVWTGDEIRTVDEIS